MEYWSGVCGTRVPDMEQAIRAALAEAAQVRNCSACNGRGMVGGFVSAYSGYQDDKCDFCAGTGKAAQVPVMGWLDPTTAPVPPAGHPLQKLGEYLSFALDEDKWATAEQMLLAAWSVSAVPLMGEAVAYACLYHTGRAKIKGCPAILLSPNEALGFKDRFPLFEKPATSITQAELDAKDARIRELESQVRNLTIQHVPEERQSSISF
ncbi:MAG: hypothetical protein AB7E72_16180 [Lysobacterales bacterium]